MIDVEQQLAQLGDAVGLQLDTNAARTDPSPLEHCAIETSLLGSTQAAAAEQAGTNGRRMRTSRWFLSAAAVAILFGGIVALAVFADSQPTPVVPADSAVDDVSLAGIDRGPFQFSEPLASGVVPFLDPPPSQPESIVRREPFDWVRGVERLVVFGVGHDDRPVSGVVVFETAVPWHVISEGLDIESVDGFDAVVVRSDGETRLFVRNGLVTRAVLDVIGQDSIGEPRIDVSSEARQVAQLIAGHSLDDLPQFDGVVHLDALNAGSATTRYGASAETVLIRETVSASISDADLAVAAELLASLSLSTSTKAVAYELVSPTDLVVVVAATQQLADTALADVQFDERPADPVPADTPLYNQVEARGEPSWGRWELATSATDPSCWKFAATIWGPDNYGNETTSCRDAAATKSLPPAFCLQMDDRIVGVFLDIDAAREFEGASESVAFDVSTEQTGSTVSFQVRDRNNPTEAPQVEITVDGSPLPCSI